MSTLIYENSTRATLAPDTYGDDDFDVILDVQEYNGVKLVEIELQDGKADGILLNRDEAQHLRDYLDNILENNLV